MDPDRGVLRGLFLAACLPALAAAVTSPGLGADLSEPLSIVGLFWLFYLPSLIFTGMFGLLIYIALKKIGWLHWWAFAATGCIAAAGFIFLFGGGHAPDTAYDWHHLLTWALVGACTAVIAWSIWRITQKRS